MQFVPIPSLFENVVIPDTLNYVNYDIHVVTLFDVVSPNTFKLYCVIIPNTVVLCDNFIDPPIGWRFNILHFVVIFVMLN